MYIDVLGAYNTCLWHNVAYYRPEITCRPQSDYVAPDLGLGALWDFQMEVALCKMKITLPFQHIQRWPLKYYEELTT